MMKKLLSLIFLAVICLGARGAEKPWSHGPLGVSANGLYLQHADGTPFFYLGDTAWLLPERLNRDEAAYYLKRAAEAGFNVAQVQTLNGVPSYNAYGRPSHVDGWDFSKIDESDAYGYWDHLDYIIDTAASQGVYIGMTCIWGGLVKAGLMTEDDARAYGRFLAERYKDKPNIIWIIGGDIQTEVKPEVWDALAETIKAGAPNHIMTFHPRGRTTSARTHNSKSWLDFNMYQSGHRRYGQRMGNKEYAIPDNTEEDCWMYVDSVRLHTPVKPVIDGEPSYEAIPKGLHSADEPLWNDKEVRRYAYWDVFAGCAGHAYGHNSIMQFGRPGVGGAYHLDTEALPWWKALDAPGYNQMKYLKRLMLTMPYFDRVADQSILLDNGTRYDRLAATCGKDYLMVYDYNGNPIHVNLAGISGKEKNLWWMDAATGSLKYLGKTADKKYRYTPANPDADGVLIAVDALKAYLTPDMVSLAEAPVPVDTSKLTE